MGTDFDALAEAAYASRNADGDEGGQDDLVIHERRSKIGDALHFVASRPKMFLAAAAVAAVAAVGLYVLNQSRLEALLAEGVADIKQENYAAAVPKIEEYLNSAGGGDEEAELWLARAHLLSGRPERIGDFSQRFDSTKPEARYFSALRAYFAAGEKFNHLESSGLLLIPVEKNARDSLARAHPEIFAADGVFKLLGGDYKGAEIALTDVSRRLRGLSGDRALVAGNYMRELYRLFLQDSRADLRAPAPAPVRFVEMDIAALQRLGFRPDVSGFKNEYSVPLAPALAAAESIVGNSKIAAEYDMLLLLSRALVGETAAEDMLATMDTMQKTAPLNSPLALYLAAYLQAQTGDYARAAETYRTINENHASPESVAYEAAATWQTQEDTAPSDAALAAYEKAADDIAKAGRAAAEPSRIAILNNYAVMRLYRGEWDAAREILAQAGEDGDDFSPHITINRRMAAMLGGEETGIDAAIVETGRAAEAMSDSPLPLDLLAQLHLRKGDFLRAGVYLKKKAELRPDDPSIRLALAALYRRHGRQLLALEEMDKALLNFEKSDADVRAAYAADKARLNDAKAVAELFGRHTLSIDNSAAGLYAKALLRRRAPSEAASLAGRALALAEDFQKTDIAFDIVRYRLRAGEVNAARQALAELESLLAESPDRRQQETLLEGLRQWMAASSGEGDPARIEELLRDELVKRNVLARAYLRQAQIALGGEHAERGLDGMRALAENTAGYSPELYRTFIHAYQQTGEDRLARALVSEVADIERNTRDRDSSGGRRRGREIFADSDNTAEDALALVLEKINEAVRDEKLQEAVGLYTSLIEDFSGSMAKPALTFQNRGALYLSIKEYDKAIDDFLKALELKRQLDAEQTAAINHNLVNSLLFARRYVEAEEKILELVDSPNHREHQLTYLQNLALVYNRQRKYNKSVDVYLTLIKKLPNNLNNYFTLANIAQIKKDYDLTIKTLQRALDIEPDSVEAHRLLADTYARIDNPEKEEEHRQIIRNLSQ